MINDGANKGAWRRQLRDRLGKWVEMYGPVKFDIQIPGVKNKSIGYGIFIGSDRYGWSKIQVEDNKYIPKGVYEIENKYITGVKAIIGLDVSKPKTTEQPKARPLLKEITGEQALVVIKKSIAKYTKGQGRFPIARNQNDVTQAAKIQYQSIFPQMKAEYPELMSKYKTPEEFWEGIKVYGVGTNQRWADSVDEISPINKALNKVYARDILGLDPENGLIAYYRNSVNRHNNLANAAAGYLSLDSRMAWDYNSHLSKYPKDRTPFDGRYKVKVKPSEVIGLIGFSNVQDEYGVVVGPDVTSIPDRAERVGDLEIQKPTDWIDDSNTFDRSTGGTPWRNFSTLSNFDYYPLESDPLPGKSFSDFRTGLGLPDDAIAKKYQELYGKDVNEALDKAGMKGGLYQGLQSMFVKFKGQDGKDYWGLDPRVLDLKYRYRGGGNIEVAEGDGYDVAIKVLSTIQELIGKPFMVNRGHDMSDSRLVEAPKVSPAIEPITEETTKQYTVKNLPVDKETPTYEDRPDLIRAVKWYTNPRVENYSDINMTLREPKRYEMLTKGHNDKMDKIASKLDEVIANSPKLTESISVYRGLRGSYSDRIGALKVGDSITDPAYLSTSVDIKGGGGFAVAPFRRGSTGNVLKIELPVGTPIFAPYNLKAGPLKEQEVILPRNTKLVVTGKEYDETYKLNIITVKLVNEPIAEEKDSTNGVRSAEEQSIMENRALNAYMAGGYRDVNAHLRGQESLRSVESFERTYNTTPEQAAKDLASLIDKSPNSLDPNETFYRGVSGAYAEQLLGLQVGDQYVENGFTSITSESEIAKRFMEHWRYASIVIQNSDAKFVYGTVQEKERILKSGIKFEVIKTDQEERKVYVKVVND
jgi:hypothetical protein